MLRHSILILCFHHPTLLRSLIKSGLNFISHDLSLFIITQSLPIDGQMSMGVEPSNGTWTTYSSYNHRNDSPPTVGIYINRAWVPCAATWIAQLLVMTELGHVHKVAFPAFLPISCLPYLCSFHLFWNIPFALARNLAKMCLSSTVITLLKLKEDKCFFVWEKYHYRQNKQIHQKEKSNK